MIIINKRVLSLIFLSAILTISSGCNNRKRDLDESDNEENIDRTLPIDTVLADNVDNCLKKYLVYGPTAIYLYDITADKPVYGYKQDSLMHSASCMKLLSGIAGLKLMGTDYKYETKLFVKGNNENGTLNGDIALNSGLDPQLLTPDLNMFAKRLKQMNISKINGNIYIDAAIKEPVKAEEHWYPWDLTFNKYGLFYKGSDRVMRDFKASLRSQGIRFDSDKVLLGKVPEGSKCIYTFYRPIANVLSRMWKNSSNTQSTSLLYTIGEKIDANGNYVQSGVDYLKEFVEQDLKQSPTSAIIHDGCGLCTHNKLTPELLVTVLRYGYHHKAIYNMLCRYLPISGKSGTLRTELTSQKIRGKIQAKTGTLSHPYGISTLAGYCTGKNGHQLCFAVMTYNMSVLDGRMIQSRLCEQFIK